MKKLISTVAIAALVLIALARLCLYTVGEREYALVFALGELKDVKTIPGLYVKLPAPLQNVVYLDKRILTMDTPSPDLVQTSEKKNLLIDSFVKWRIEDPRNYWVSFQGSERAAEDRMASRRLEPNREPPDRQRNHVQAARAVHAGHPQCPAGAYERSRYRRGRRAT